jgi:RNA polymerase sigma-32 factor
VFYNLKLAIKIAYQYKKSWNNLMDLVQEACVGMIIASKKWDPDKNTRFGTYSLYWIKAQLSRFLMLNFKIVNSGNTRIGRKMYSNLFKVYKKIFSYGKKASLKLIAKNSNEYSGDLAIVLTPNNKELYNPRKVCENTPNEIPASHNLSSQGLTSPEKIIEKSQLQSGIKESINNFYFLITNERDRYIWLNCLASDISISLVAIGKKFFISKQRVGQLIKRLKAHFKKYMLSNLGYNYADFK